jgi:hypothetical protein
MQIIDPFPGFLVVCYGEGLVDSALRIGSVHKLRTLRGMPPTEPPGGF